MTSTVEPAASPEAPGPYDALRLDLPPRRTLRDRGRRFWSILAVLVVLVVGGAIAAVAVSFHYLHAPGLESDGAGWAPPDNGHVRYVQIGGVQGMIVPARPGHAQTFYVDIYNPSSVTQTFLGSAIDTADTASPIDLAISTTDTSVGASKEDRRYTTKPVDIRPHGSRALRVTLHTSRCDGPGGSESFDGLSVRVRVGWFTRTETIDMSTLVMELDYTKAPACR